MTEEADKQVYVEMINRTRREAILNTGETLPVTNWFGPDGQDCEPDDAVVCVAGDDEFGWCSVDLRHFEEIVRN